MLIILFGLAGAGKNHIAQILSSPPYDYYFCDADTALTQEIKLAIQTKTPFTQQMRDNYTDVIIKKISELQPSHPNLVITQALYKEKNRKVLLSHFPDAKFIWVTSLPALINNRLKQRKDWVDEEYANLLQKDFENPTLPHFKIENNEDKTALITNLNQLLRKSPPLKKGD